MILEEQYETSSQNDSAHMRSYEVDLEEGIILMDIGGGSVDFSIIQSDECGRLDFKFIENSLAIAGKSILVSLLAEIKNNLNTFKEVMVNLGMDEETVKKSAGFDASKGNKETKQYAPFELYCEVCLSGLDEKKFREIIENQEETKLGYISTIILFNLSAISFYAGKLLCEADQKSRSSGDVGFIFSESQSIKYLACGNGSKLFSWVKPTDMECIEKAFLAGIGERGSDYSVRIIQSNNPKSEVACGLVSVRHLDKGSKESTLPFFDRIIIDKNGKRENEASKTFLSFFNEFIDFFRCNYVGYNKFNSYFDSMLTQENMDRLLNRTIQMRRMETNISKLYAFSLDSINKEFRRLL